MKTKICIKCKLNKKLKEFSQDNYRKDGFHHTCRKCRDLKYYADRGRTKPIKIIPKKGFAICPVCKIEKLNVNFGRAAGTPSGLQSVCKECQNKYRRSPTGKEAHARWSKNPKAIYATIKMSSIKRNVDLIMTLEEFMVWYASQNRICVYCKRDESEVIKDRSGRFKRLTIDRKDNDKGYTVDNLVLACYRCNDIKSDDISYEKMLEIGRIISKC